MRALPPVVKRQGLCVSADRVMKLVVKVLISHPGFPFSTWPSAPKRALCSLASEELGIEKESPLPISMLLRAYGWQGEAVHVSKLSVDTFLESVHAGVDMKSLLQCVLEARTGANRSRSSDLL